MDKKNTLQYKEAKLPCPCKEYIAKFSTRENILTVSCKNKSLCEQMMNYLNEVMETND